MNNLVLLRALEKMERIRVSVTINALDKLLRRNSFPDHRGRPGLKGGSLPRTAGGAVGKTKLFSGKIAKFVKFALGNVKEHGEKTGNERLIGINEKGDMIFSRDGNSNSVQVEGLPINDAVITVHNHPTSSNFSEPDMGLFINTDSKHMAIIGHNGDMYIVSKPDGWNKSSYTGWGEEFNQTINETRPIYNQWRINGLGDWEASRQARYAQMNIFSESMGLEYKQIIYGVDYGKPIVP